jgi:REP element-mobilizing transposase RayT
MTYNPDIHHRCSIRLREYDYSSIGAYFVTICAYERECLFGDIVDGEMRLNGAGRVVGNVWEALPERFPQVALDEYVIMPNHFHGIICIVGAPLAAPLPFVSEKRGAASSAPTLGSIVRAFKSISAIGVNRLLNRQGCPLWQRNYYERVIRDDFELSATREYIHFNPANWADDEERPT